MFTSNGSNDIILFSVCFSTTSRVFIIQQIYREKYFYDEHHKLIKERILFRTSKFDFLTPSPQKNTIPFFFHIILLFLIYGTSGSSSCTLAYNMGWYQVLLPI